MGDVVEIEHVTDTKRRLLKQRKSRAWTPSQVYVTHRLGTVANVYHELGGQAGLVYLAILGSYHVADASERAAGFTVRPVFQSAVALGDRQFRRAVAKLVDAGYIEADTKPGRKGRIRLTAKGMQGLTRIHPTREDQGR